MWVVIPGNNGQNVEARGGAVGGGQSEGEIDGRGWCTDQLGIALPGNIDQALVVDLTGHGQDVLGTTRRRHGPGHLKWHTDYLAVDQVHVGKNCCHEEALRYWTLARSAS